MEKFYEDYYSNLEQNIGSIPWYIVKPDEGSQGTGIYIIHTPEQLQNLKEPQLVQEYVAEPFLFQDHLKFDLRVYAVIRSIQPLSIYVAREGTVSLWFTMFRLVWVLSDFWIWVWVYNGLG